MDQGDVTEKSLPELSKGMARTARVTSAMSQHWRQAAAYVYLLICLVDFVFMPLYYEYANARVDNQNIVSYAMKFDDGASQVAALQILKEQRSWQPITLDSAGWIHISFGAILGVSAFARRRKEEDEE